MKRTHFLVAVALVMGCALTSYAEDYLHVRTSSGWDVVDLSQAEYITFSGTEMKILDASRNVVKSYPKASLEKMYVAETSGVTNIEADGVEATFRFDAANQQAVMLADGNFTVYNTEGKTLVNIKGAKNGETISLANMHCGVAVVKSGSQTLKVVLK